MQFDIAAGQAVKLYADIYPAVIDPWPEGVPTTSVRKRVVVHEFGMTIGWSLRTGTGTEIERVDLPFTAEELAAVSFTGGEVGPLVRPETEGATKRQYTVGRAAACSSCGSQRILSWEPFPGVVWVSEPRQASAEDEYRRRHSTWAYGTIPRRTP